MKDRKRKTIAFFSTIAFHVLAIFVLLLLGLTYPEPPPQEIGVEMNLGSLDGLGNALPGEPGGSDGYNIVANPQTDDESYATQSAEPTNITSKPATTINKPQTPVTNPAPTPAIDPNALYNKGKVNANGGGGQGTGQGSGIGQGNNGGGGTGTDLTGSGTSFSLGDRKAKSLTTPTTSTSEVGTVVVEIFVGRDGDVLRVKAGAKGTTISNEKVFRECEAAARSSKFSSKTDAVEEQKGTITYNFKR
ncbi:MAG: hypothetical protein LBO06_03265 [Bacteroidales bacterium]|jgi:outer membrane biosynthesis protein TonB|nr:hypothetical protein [Bacteroidales bacterium]